MGLVLVFGAATLLLAAIGGAGAADPMAALRSE
jgi:hypothetical protein